MCCGKLWIRLGEEREVLVFGIDEGRAKRGNCLSGVFLEEKIGMITFSIVLRCFKWK